MKNLISPKHYIKSLQDLNSLEELKRLFQKNIKPDGVRNRAYLKLIWNRATDEVLLAKNQAYFQTAQSNKIDGGKVREFAVMDSAILKLSIVENMIRTNIGHVAEYEPLKKYQHLVLGLHFIQYRVHQYGASYSSPDNLHRDDEPMVFIHLVNLSKNALGGDNIIADLETREITNVARLEKPFETMLLTRDYYHAVTPLGSRHGVATRDIILFTVEPNETQVEEVA